MPYKDKEKQRETYRKWKENNVEYTRERSRKWNMKCRQRHREYINTYLLNHPCVDCGEKDPIVLEFDHVRGTKYKNVSEMESYSLENLQKEIDKCEVRCANCHRRITYKRRVVSTPLL